MNNCNNCKWWDKPNSLPANGEPLDIDKVHRDSVGRVRMSKCLVPIPYYIENPTTPVTSSSSGGNCVSYRLNK